MVSCDICGRSTHSGAKQYSAAHVRWAADAGFRPVEALARFRPLAGVVGIEDGHLVERWLEEVRRDRTDWLLCWSCSNALAQYLRPTGGPPLPGEPVVRGRFLRWVRKRSGVRGST
ncbi:hypothetical protein [Amycolatopsis jejuensis]|uniref:hypothetical protein n=1 Tax=Amycolatopsis jejuensis TaxID=330084 RepID=UPI0005263C64|nr:hypothetical protein [Amycolatopsis jejuensis]